jgi:hypothetical protein
MRKLEVWWSELRALRVLDEGYACVRLDRAQPPTTEVLHRVLAGLRALA